MIQSVWLFPAVVVAGLIILTVLRLSGSSVGYYRYVTAQTGADTNLVSGTIRPVRSDEWLVNTQLILAQQKAGWPRTNVDVGNGQDMSIVADVPYREWSVAFKPQNLAFFVMPVEYAFAFKWWLLLAALLISAYFFALELVPKHRLYAIGAALVVSINPFIFWWYQTITIAPIVYVLTMSIVIMRLWRTRHTWVRISLSVLLVYLAAAFALIMYPPFQIPCALAMAVLLIGYGIETYTEADQRQFWLNFIYITGAGLMAGIIALVFIKTRPDAVAAITHTVYPGKRLVTSGGYNLVLLFGNFMSSQLTNPLRAISLPHNQSEASNFILVAPYLVLPSLYFIVTAWRKHHHIDWMLLGVNAMYVVLVARMVLPWPNLPYRLLLLQYVPPERILIGLGVLGFMQLVLIYRHLIAFKPTRSPLVMLLAGGSALAVTLLVGERFHRHYPGYMPEIWLIVLLASVVAVSAAFIVWRRTAVLGVFILAGISIYSANGVMPLYRGLAVLTDSAVIKMLESTPATSRIAVNNSVVFENFPLLAGRQTITGVEEYPQLSLWKPISDSAASQKVYNRFAHITLVIGPKRGFSLLGGDHFAVELAGCDPYIAQHLDYILSAEAINSPCLVPSDSVSYPNQTLTLYHVISAPTP